jgi:hypothetical protein
LLASVGWKAAVMNIKSKIKRRRCSVCQVFCTSTRRFARPWRVWHS